MRVLEKVELQTPRLQLAEMFLGSQKAALVEWLRQSASFADVALYESSNLPAALYPLPSFFHPAVIACTCRIERGWRVEDGERWWWNGVGRASAWCESCGGVEEGVEEDVGVR